VPTIVEESGKDYSPQRDAFLRTADRSVNPYPYRRGWRQIR
jgi:hypothetical protein